MRRFSIFALLVAIATIPGSAQQAAQSAESPVPGNQLAAKGITPPKPLNTVEPEYSNEARRKNLNGQCLVKLTVDTEGNPQNIITNCTDPSFEKGSLDAAAKFRFNPATTQDGKPVAVVISIEFNFRLFDGVNTKTPIRYTFSSPPGVRSADPGPDGVFPLTKLGTPPVITEFSDKKYRIFASFDANSSACDIVLTISAKGKPSDPQVTHCDRPEVEKPAVDSLLKSKYKPGKVNGKAVPMRASIHLESGVIPPKSYQQVASSAPSLPADAKPTRVKVYAVGPDVTAPELLPLDMAPIAAESCKKKVDGKVVLSVIVDAKGNPRNLMFTQTFDADLDKLAYQIVSADRFKPGTKDGTPVAIAQSVEVDMQACIEQTEDNTGENTTVVRLISKSVQKFETISQTPEEAVLTSDITPSEDSYASAYPLYRIGGDVKAPMVIQTANVEFSDEARRAHYQGVCMVELIVDKYGMPRQLRSVRPLGMGLDQKAIEAIRKYRFQPAMKNGEPVSVKIAVQVDFRLLETPSKN